MFLLPHNDLDFIKMATVFQQYQRPFEDQKIFHKQKYLYQQLSLLAALD